MQGGNRAQGEASGRTFDVFISHAGPQKANFAAWLQHELCRSGISAFLDETSLRYGDAADVEMEATLRSCSVVVVVLTPDYLRSSYCLQELHWALHPRQPQPQQAAAGGALQQPHWSQSTTQRSNEPPRLLPVFYHTSDIGALQQEVRQQVAAAYYRSAPLAELERLQQASTDLAALCRLTGDRPDSHGMLDKKHVDAIVAEVLERLEQPSFQAPTYVVDLEARVQALLSLLQPDQPGYVRVLSLHGMGGIGKTTLAKELFSRLSTSSRLSGSSLRFSSEVFLDVGQEVALQDKQRQLISMLAGRHLPMAGSAAHLQQQLERCTRQGGPLLLVLDDIWNTGQRDGLLCLSVLPAGSRVILTGRNSGNLHADHGCCVARPVEVLAAAKAEKLLCQHAFRAEQAPPEYAAAVKHALAVCGNLPLALQVVDAGMRNLQPSKAEESVRQLLAAPGDYTGRADAAGRSLDMLTLLKWSYAQLTSDNHRHLFLDAALLMREHPRDHLIHAWAGILQQQEEDRGQRHPSSPEKLQDDAEGLWNGCISATLVTGSSADMQHHIIIRVHDCLVEMAESVRRDGPAGWTLSSLSPATTQSREYAVGHPALRLRCVPLVGMADVLPWTLSQLLGRHGQCQLAAVDVPHLPAAPASGDAVSSNQSGMASWLVYLRLAAVPQQWAIGGRLRALDVSDHSVSEFNLPDSIAACSELRHLRLSIWQLQSLPDSMGSLHHLQALQLKGCSRLALLPSSFSQLHQLRYLNLAGCDALQQLPVDIGSLPSLKSLDVSSCVALRRLPDSVGSLSTLWMLSMRACAALEQLPDSVGFLTRLRQLDVNGCTALSELPDSIGSLSRLDTLFAGECLALQHLPESIGRLASLTRLHVGNCVALQQLPGSIGSLSSLQTLFSFGLKALQRLPDSIGDLRSLVTLWIGNCPALEELPPSIGSLGSLTSLDCRGCKALRLLPDSIGGLSNLRDLNISWCQGLEQLPDSIRWLHQLETLDMCGCMALRQLPDSIGSLSSLISLDVSHSAALAQLPDSLGSLFSLQSMYARYLSLEKLPDSIGSLPRLRKLDVSNCAALQRLPASISRRPSSQQLTITGAGDLASGSPPPVPEQQLPAGR